MIDRDYSFHQYDIDIDFVHYFFSPQDNGSLHGHLVSFGGIPTTVLQKFANLPYVRDKMIAVLESIFTTSLPIESHVKAVVSKLQQKQVSQRPAYRASIICRKGADHLRNFRPNVASKQATQTISKDTLKPTSSEGGFFKYKKCDAQSDVVQKTLDLRRMRKDLSDALLDHAGIYRILEIEKYSNRATTMIGVHSHSKRCIKGTFGKKADDLAKPASLIIKTRPVEMCLDADRFHTHIPQTATCDVNEAEPLYCPGLRLEGISDEDIKNSTCDRNYNVYPLPPMDNRAIYWEQSKPPVIEGQTSCFTDKENPFYHDTEFWPSFLGIADTDLDFLPKFMDELKEKVAERIESMPEEVKEEINKLTPEELQKVYQYLITRNAFVVEHSKIVTALLGTNTAMYMLGSRMQANVTLFYISNYVTKNVTSLAQSVILFHQAQTSQRLYPSQAEDKETLERQAKCFATKFLNSYNLIGEIAPSQSACALLGIKSQWTSTNFYYVFWRNAANYAKKRLYNHTCEMTAEDMQALESDPDTQYGESDSDVELNEKLVDQQIIKQIAKRTRLNKSLFAESQMVVDNASLWEVEDKKVAVPSYAGYAFRGPELQCLNQYEYAALIRFDRNNTRNRGDIKKQKQFPVSDAYDSIAQQVCEGMDMDLPPDDSKCKGRVKNARFEFHSDHPLHGQYAQFIKSKIDTPILAGKSLPKYPGPTPEIRTPNWDKEANDWAFDILSIFSPWDLETHLPIAGHNWDDFCRFMRELESDVEHHQQWLDDLSSDPPDRLQEEDDNDVDDFSDSDWIRYINYGRLTLIKSLAFDHRVTQEDKMAFQMYRRRDNEVWKNLQATQMQQWHGNPFFSQASGLDNLDDYGTKHTNSLKTIDELRSAHG